MYFLDFPNEIIQNILKFLPVEDILNLSIICTRLNDVCNISEVWNLLCQRDFQVSHSVSDQFTTKTLYLKVLRPYGTLMGLWQPSIAAYGGLCCITYRDGFLHADELHAPQVRKIQNKLRVKKLFKIGLEDGKLCKWCFVHNGKMHQANISVKSKDRFEYSCGEVTAHRSGEERQEEFQQFLDWFREEEPQTELLLLKFMVLREYNLSFEYNRLRWPIFKKTFPLEPGLFKGSYGAHGLELIMLRFEETEKDGYIQIKAKGEKITGDPNVPANQVSFHANLDFPIFNLSLEDQENSTLLERFQPIESKFSSRDRDPEPQPFRLPDDCFERSSFVPTVCSQRYHGYGQIASHGFSNPSYTKGHWIIFDNNTFAFLWLELQTLSMYHRVCELSNKDC